MNEQDKLDFKRKEENEYFIREELAPQSIDTICQAVGGLYEHHWAIDIELCNKFKQIAVDKVVEIQEDPRTEILVQKKFVTFRPRKSQACFLLYKSTRKHINREGFHLFWFFSMDFGEHVGYIRSHHYQIKRPPNKFSTAEEMIEDLDSGFTRSLQTKGSHFIAPGWSSMANSLDKWMDKDVINIYNHETFNYYRYDTECTYPTKDPVTTYQKLNVIHAKRTKDPDCGWTLADRTEFIEGK